MKGKRKTRCAGMRHRDPDALCYASPIASRAYILKVIAEADRPFIRESLTKQLGITTEQDLGAVRRRFNAMLRSSQLVGNDCDCYALPSQLDLIHGRVISYSDGFGLLVPDSGGKDMFLSAAGQMHTLFHGSSP